MSLHAIRQHRAVRVSGKRAEDVAARIEAHIVQLGWPAGQVLGSERELLDKYKVSRATLREAVRLLEHHMVARMRPGPRGGLVVMKPDADVVSRAMALYLSHAGVDARQLLEMRGIIEGQAAALAAANATPIEIDEMRVLLAEENERVEGSYRHTKDFHLHVAEMSRNPVMVLFVRCLTALTEARTVPALARKEIAGRVNDIHTRIAESIMAGDSETARRRMTRHIHAIDEFLDDKGTVVVAKAKAKARA